MDTKKNAKNIFKLVNASISKGCNISMIYAVFLGLNILISTIDAASLKRHHIRHKRNQRGPGFIASSSSPHRNQIFDICPLVLDEYETIAYTHDMDTLSSHLGELIFKMKDLKNLYLENRIHEDYHNMVEYGFTGLPVIVSKADMSPDNLDIELNRHYYNLVRLTELWWVVLEGEKLRHETDLAPHFEEILGTHGAKNGPSLALLLCQLDRWMQSSDIELKHSSLDEETLNVINEHLNVNIKESDTSRRIRDGILLHHAVKYLEQLSNDVTRSKL